MKRIFLAIELPVTIKEKIVRLQNKICANYAWVKKEQLHLTLVFLGDTREEDIEVLKRELYLIAMEPFTIELNSLGYFSRHRIAHILWLDLINTEKVSALFASISQRIKKINIPLEDKKKFYPHITIGRAKSVKAHEIQVWIEKNGPLAKEILSDSCILIDHYTLFSSVLSSKGAVHSPEAVFSLNSEKLPANT